MKRLLDVVVSLAGLLAIAPVLLILMLLIWLQDLKSPLYRGLRVGRRGRDFRMVKLRSMVANADQSGVDSTAINDLRITPIGSFVRRYKLDEFPQLWNVLRGDMSLVGPRPNVRSDVDLYTATERRLLEARPGITDLSSIVFSDEGEILAGSDDPDLRYNQIIRPHKSRLGLLYVESSSLAVDLRILFLTAIGLVSRPRALAGVQQTLRRLGAEARLVEVAGRDHALAPCPPPGATEIVESRDPAGIHQSTSTTGGKANGLQDSFR